jgi:hypothetical protein
VRLTEVQKKILILVSDGDSMPKLPENPPLLCEVWDAHGFVGYYGGPDNLPYPERSKAFKIF